MINTTCWSTIERSSYFHFSQFDAERRSRLFFSDRRAASFNVFTSNRNKRWARKKEEWRVPVCKHRQVDQMRYTLRSNIKCDSMIVNWDVELQWIDKSSDHRFIDFFFWKRIDSPNVFCSTCRCSRQKNQSESLQCHSFIAFAHIFNAHRSSLFPLHWIPSASRKFLGLFNRIHHSSNTTNSKTKKKGHKVIDFLDTCLICQDKIKH